MCIVLLHSFTHEWGKILWMLPWEASFSLPAGAQLLTAKAACEFQLCYMKRRNVAEEEKKTKPNQNPKPPKSKEEVEWPWSPARKVKQGRGSPRFPCFLSCLLTSFLPPFLPILLCCVAPGLSGLPLTAQSLLGFFLHKTHTNVVWEAWPHSWHYLWGWSWGGAPSPV